MTNLIDSEAMGVEVSWSFGFGDAEAVQLDRVVVLRMLSTWGFNQDYLKALTPEDALKRAAETVKGRGQKIVIKKMKRAKGTALSMGVYEVIAKEGEGGDKFVCGARTRIQPGGDVRAMLPENYDKLGGTTTGQARCMEIADEISRIANMLTRTAFNLDISMMLVTIGHAEMNWISRRKNGGGVYYISNGKRAERFVGLLKHLEDATSGQAPSSRFYPQLTEMYPKPLALGTWRQAAGTQFSNRTSALVAALKVMGAGKMREKTVTKHMNECDRILAEAEEHRMFLAEGVEDIAEQINAIKAGFVAGNAENIQAIDVLFADVERQTA